MIYRNETNVVFAALILNDDERIDLGKTTAIEMFQRAAVTVKSRIDLSIETCRFFYASSKDGLNRLIKDGGAKIYDHEGLNPNSQLYGLEKDVIDSIQMIDDETPSPFPGITMNQLMEAQASPEYKAYLIYALHPDKRVGVSHDDIKDARIAWEQAYPTIATYVPKWIDDS